MNFFEFILFVIYSVSWIHELMSFATLGNSFNFYLNVFQFCHFLFLLRLWLTWVLDPIYSFTDPWGSDFVLLMQVFFFPVQIAWFLFFSLQFSSVIQSCLTLCKHMDCSTPGLPVHHQLSQFTQTHVHWVGYAIQPFHTVSSPSPPAFNFSQHQGLIRWVSSSHQVARILEFQLWHQSFQWIFMTDFL